MLWIIIYAVCLILIGTINCLFGFKKLPSKRVKISFFIIVVTCLSYQGIYTWIEKQESINAGEEIKNSQDEIIAGQYGLSGTMRRVEGAVDNLKESEEKDLLKNDPLTYISLELTNIKNELSWMRRKSFRELVSTYYDEVNKIPVYFNSQEWVEAEKFIYAEIAKSIGSRARNREHKQEMFVDFKQIHDSLVQAKER